jgi:hypothetical protein
MMLAIQWHKGNCELSFGNVLKSGHSIQLPTILQRAMDLHPAGCFRTSSGIKKLTDFMSSLEPALDVMAQTNGLHTIS